jgi:hypothetical protein
MSLYLLQARCEPRRFRASIFVGEGLPCRFPVGLRGCNHVEGCVQLFAGSNDKLSLIMIILGWRASHPPRGTPSGVHDRRRNDFKLHSKRSASVQFNSVQVQFLTELN